MDTTALATLLEKQAITELMTRYNTVIDRCEFENWARCFTEDGVFAGAYKRYTLPTDLAQFERDSREEMSRYPNLRHYVTNVEVTPGPQPDTATARSFLLMLSTAPTAEPGGMPKSQVVQAGTYTDDLVKVNGQWRIQLRQVAVDGV